MLFFFQCVSLIDSMSSALHNANFQEQLFVPALSLRIQGRASTPALFRQYLSTAQDPVRHLFILQPFRNSKQEGSKALERLPNFQEHSLEPSSLLGELFIKALLYNRLWEKEECSYL